MHRVGPDGAVEAIKATTAVILSRARRDSCHSVTTAPCCRLTQSAECRHAHRVGTSSGHGQWPSPRARPTEFHRVWLHAVLSPSGCLPYLVQPNRQVWNDIARHGTARLARYGTARTARRSPQSIPTARPQQPATSAGKNCARRRGCQPGLTIARSAYFQTDSVSRQTGERP